MVKKKVIFVVAHNGYQHIEYGIPKRMLEDANIEVVTASNLPGFAIAKDSSTTPVDLTINKIDTSLYDGFFFIGGPGALENLDNPTSYIFAQKIAKSKKPWGAICISPRILAKAGVLTGKKATGWNDDGLLPGIFKQHGVTLTRHAVVADDNLITAIGPSAVVEWADEIIKHIHHQLS